MDEAWSPEIISVDDWINAADRGDTVFVLDALQCGMDVDACGRAGRTALMAAVKGGRLDVIRILLEHGADPNRENDRGDTAVTFAVLRARPWRSLQPDPGPLNLLLSAGGRYRLYEAVQMNDLEIARARLDEGADPNVDRFSYEGPVLMIAAARGDLMMVEMLLDYGADREARNDLLRTPLVMAASNGCTEVVRLLLDRGADLHAVDGFGHVTVERPSPPRGGFRPTSHRSRRRRRRRRE